VGRQLVPRDELYGSVKLFQVELSRGASPDGDRSSLYVGFEGISTALSYSARLPID
jgi:hypothetical protein